MTDSGRVESQGDTSPPAPRSEGDGGSTPDSCSSEEEEREVPWVFYRDRDEWKDVTPLGQDDGPFPVVRIAYTEKFCDVYDYFRAVLKCDERSGRAFQLTSDAIQLNSANYTVWQFRRVLLKSLDKDLNQELKYITEIIKEHPKNYQVWHHRRVIVEWLHDSSHEFEFTEQILRGDAKNYHAWQHRQWVIQEFSEWDAELKYVNRLIEQDVRNNSAWNQRYFVISNTTKYSHDVVNDEVRYTLNHINSVPHNESAWNYLRGVLEEGGLYQSEVRQFCERLYGEEGLRAPHLLAYMIDMYDEWVEESVQGGGVMKGCLEPAQRTQLVQSMLKMCSELSDVHDTIRTQYWMYVARTLSTKYSDYISTTTTQPNNQSGDTLQATRDTSDQSGDGKGLMTSS